VLLVGETPHDPDVLRKAAVDEMLRIIRDEEPPTPSRRWSSLNRKRTESVADRRDTRPEALGEILRSDLGWIVMKALDRDRARRYGSAAELSADINRYREHRPVLAGPPTTGYRVAKFVKRHRTAVLWASTVLTILLIAIATTRVVAIKSSTRLDRLLRLSDFRRIEELHDILMLLHLIEVYLLNQILILVHPPFVLLPVSFHVLPKFNLLFLDVQLKLPSLADFFLLVINLYLFMALPLILKVFLEENLQHIILEYLIITNSIKADLKIILEHIQKFLVFLVDLIIFENFLLHSLLSQLQILDNEGQIIIYGIKMNYLSVH